MCPSTVESIQRTAQHLCPRVKSADRLRPVVVEPQRATTELKRMKLTSTILCDHVGAARPGRAAIVRQTKEGHSVLMESRPKAPKLQALLERRYGPSVFASPRTEWEALAENSTAFSTGACEECGT